MEWITIGIVIGVALWTYLNMPKIPKVTQKPGEVQAPICEDGAPIPVVFGTVCIKGANVTTWGGVHTGEIPEGKTKGQLLYWITMRMCLCHGQIDSILKVLINEKFATRYPITTDSQVKISGDSILSTEKYLGDVTGTIRCRMGAHNWELGANPGVYSKPSEINGETDGKGPGFFGIACVELENVMVGGSPYLAPWAFVVQRIMLRNDWETYGSAQQWYPEKAMIPHGVTGETTWLFEHGEDESLPDSDKDAWLAANVPDSESWSGPYFMPFYEGTAPTGLPSVGADGGLHLWPAGNHVWAKSFIFTDPADFAFFSKVYLFVYAENAAWVWIDDQYVGATNPTNDRNVTTVGVNFDVTDRLRKAGMHSITIYGVDEVPHDSPHSTYLYARVVTSPIVDNNVDAATLNSYVDMNPAHIIRECLTDPVWGMGYLPDDVDDITFSFAALRLYLERFGLSIQWSKPGSIEDFLNEILRHINGTLYVDRLTGQWKLSLVREGYDVNSLLHLDESSIEKLEGVSRRATGDLVNQVSVSYTSSMMGEEATVTVTEPGLVQSQGAVISHKIDYPGITTHDLASRVALRDLKALSSPSLSCTVVANRKAASLNPGDAFVVTWPECGLNNTVMRVAAIELGDGRTNRVRIKCVEDVFGSPDYNVVSAGDTPWMNPTATPISVPDPVTEDNYQYASTFMPAKLTDRALKQSVDAVFCFFADPTGLLPTLFNTRFPSNWDEIRPGVWRNKTAGQAWAESYLNGVQPFRGMRVVAAFLSQSVDPTWQGTPCDLEAEDKPRTGIYVVTDPGFYWDEATRTYVSTYAQLERASDMSTGDQLGNGCVVGIGGGTRIGRTGTINFGGKYAHLTTESPISLGTTPMEWELLNSYSAVRGDNLLTEAQTKTIGDATGDTINLSATSADPSPWVTFATLDGTPNAQTYPAGRTRWKLWCYFAAGDQSATTVIKCRMVKFIDIDHVTVLAEADSDPIVGGDEIFLKEYKTHDDVNSDQAISGAKIAVQYQLTTTSSSQVVVRLRYGDNLYVTRVDTPLVIGATQGGFDHTPYGPVIAIDADGILTIPNIDECSGTIRVSGSSFKGIAIYDSLGNAFIGGDKLKIRFTESCTVYQNQTVRVGAVPLNLSTMGGLTGDDLNIALGPRSSAELQYDDFVNSWEAASPPVVM